MLKFWLIAILLLSFLLTGCEQTEQGLLLKTADPAVALLVPFAPVPEAEVDEPDIAPEDEVGVDEPIPLPDPPCELTKANISRDGRKLYHVEGMPNFNTVKIDEAAGERFFCSTAEAEAAGWVRAGN